MLFYRSWDLVKGCDNNQNCILKNCSGCSLVDEAKGPAGKPLSRQEVLVLTPGWGGVEVSRGSLAGGEGETWTEVR